MVASSSTTLMILGRPYLLSSLSEGPALFCPGVGNVSPSPPQEGRPLPPLWFFEGHCPRDRGEGAEQQPPPVPSLQSGEAITPVPLTAGTWGLPFQAPCPLPLTRDTGEKCPIFAPLMGPSLGPRASPLGVSLTEGHLDQTGKG